MSKTLRSAEAMITELTIECVGGMYLKEECVKVVEFDAIRRLELNIRV